MANPIVHVSVAIYYKPKIVLVEVDTRESGEWDAARVKGYARQVAYERERDNREKPEIIETDVIIVR